MGGGLLCFCKFDLFVGFWALTIYGDLKMHGLCEKIGYCTDLKSEWTIIYRVITLILESFPEAILMIINISGKGGMDFLEFFSLFTSIFSAIAQSILLYRELKSTLDKQKPI